MLHHANALDLILLDEPNADAGLVIEKAEDEVDGLHHALCTLSHFRWLCDAGGAKRKAGEVEFADCKCMHVFLSEWCVVA